MLFGGISHLKAYDSFDHILKPLKIILLVYSAAPSLFWVIWLTAWANEDVKLVLWVTDVLYCIPDDHIFDGMGFALSELIQL